MTINSVRAANNWSQVYRFLCWCFYKIFYIKLFRNMWSLFKNLMHVFLRYIDIVTSHKHRQLCGCRSCLWWTKNMIFVSKQPLPSPFASD